MFATIVTIALLAVLGGQDAEPQVAIEPMGGDEHRITVTLTGQPEQATLSRLLGEAAASVCGARFPHYGRYHFELNEPAPGQSADLPTTFVFEQSITCADEPEQEPPQPAQSSLTEPEMAALEPQILELSTLYFDALGAGRWAEAYAMADEAMHGGQSLEEWSRGQGEAEPASSRDLLRVTWYQNPPDVPAGLYGAVDYTARHAVEGRCGYLIWYRAASDASFRLTRSEETLIPDTLDDATRSQIRSLHCRDS